MNFCIDLILGLKRTPRPTAANMPGLVPFVGEKTVSGSGLTRDRPDDIGAGVAVGTGTQSTLLRDRDGLRYL